MRIYIAAKFSQRTFLRTLLPRLEKELFVITSSWITEDESDFHEMKSGDLYIVGRRDIVDIVCSDAVVQDTLEELIQGAGGGREWEAGYGAGLGKRYWRVGPARNPFHYSAARVYKSWEDVIDGKYEGV